MDDQPVVFRYLYFDITRTMQIVGKNALAEANKTILSPALVDRSNSTNQIGFCLTGTVSTTAALQVRVDPNTGLLSSTFTSHANEIGPLDGRAVPRYYSLLHFDFLKKLVC